MTDHILQVFSSKAALNQPVFVTFVTAGFPNPKLTIPILLAMEAGGADIIELGVPFNDPLADGTVIQNSNKVALTHGVKYSDCLGFVKGARKKGLKAPVIIMGYYNTLLSYGEKLAVSEAREVGANGFIVVDLPPEEAIELRKLCRSTGLSYVPLISPSTSDSRIKFLTSIADSFVYVVSKMGITGASTSIDSSLSKYISRIRDLSPMKANHHLSLVVGFGVSSTAQFEDIGAVSDGVVIGSKIISILDTYQDHQAIKAVQSFCEEICGGKQGRQRAMIDKKSPEYPRRSSESQISNLFDLDRKENGFIHLVNDSSLSAYFGEFGGQYVPESMIEPLMKLEACYKVAKSDPKFKAEYESYYEYMNRPSALYYAEKLTKKVGGGKIWFKREDLNFTGSHNINNVIGQAILATRLGKKRVIAETSGGQHGIATATVGVKFGLECVIYMGSKDARRHETSVLQMRMMGAKVVLVTSGTQSLKDAISDAMRDWVGNLDTTYYIVGSVNGPHPIPTIVRDFQCVIGNEIKDQMQTRIGKLPDAVIACVGGGGNAIGSFYPFLNDTSVRLIGVEAGGLGIDTMNHSASLNQGSKGILHGTKTHVLQSSDGQILQTHSIATGLNYPGVGPEHAFLKEQGRVSYRVANNLEALKALKMCVENEGIIPALETAHAISGTIELAQELGKEANIVMCFSGRGDTTTEQFTEIDCFDVVDPTSTNQRRWGW
ncbi:tryptophan synthase beta subunit-like PLP-dependent enzyme [Melampsora americana]|nr:tryptophan synthase beta subunit-like PLP-dependent enzyme [Melampsora americana]